MKKRADESAYLSLIHIYPELQGRMFRALGLTDEEAHEKFGFLTDAFQYGAPPHGGMGIGLDRLVMQMLGAATLRDVVAFPKAVSYTHLLWGPANAWISVWSATSVPTAANKEPEPSVKRRLKRIPGLRNRRFRRLVF